MTGARIQSDERGITLNKTLAWTMLVTLLGGAFWLGSMLNDVAGKIETVAEVQQQAQREAAEVRARVSALERSEARGDARLENILQLLARIDTRMDRLEQSQ